MHFLNAPPGPDITVPVSGCWCPGNARIQGISILGIGYIGELGSCLLQGRFSATLAISLRRSDRIWKPSSIFCWGKKLFMTSISTCTRQHLVWHTMISYASILFTSRVTIKVNLSVLSLNSFCFGELHIISRFLMCTCIWNLPSWKSRTCSSCTVRIIVVDVLVTHGARSSAAILVTVKSLI